MSNVKHKNRLFVFLEHPGVLPNSRRPKGATTASGNSKWKWTFPSYSRLSTRLRLCRPRARSPGVIIVQPSGYVGEKHRN